MRIDDHVMQIFMQPYSFYSYFSCLHFLHMFIGRIWLMLCCSVNGFVFVIMYSLLCLWFIYGDLKRKKSIRVKYSWAFSKEIRPKNLKFHLKRAYSFKMVALELYMSTWLNTSQPPTFLGRLVVLVVLVVFLRIQKNNIAYDIHHVEIEN